MLAHMPSVVPFERTLDGVLGLRYEELGPELAAGSMVLDERHDDGTGHVHGGVFASIAESLASIGTTIQGAASEPPMTASGMSNDTTVMVSPAIAPGGASSLHGRARRRIAGPREAVWDVEIETADGTLCALTKMVIALRPMRGSGA